jgi:prophage antirepressor-like protein
MTFTCAPGSSTAAVRVVTREGEPWFVLADVCKVLDAGLPADQARRLDDDEKGMEIIHTLGGQQKTTIISESGLYSLVLTSRKPEAKRFKRWITGEVIPSIRRTGKLCLTSK